MKRIFHCLLIFLGLLVMIGACGIFGLYLWVSDGLPDIARPGDYRAPLATTVYARDGSVIGYLFREKRFAAEWDAMPDHLPKAFVAAEDSSFFRSSISGNYRALLCLIRPASSAGGALCCHATFPQILAKRLLSTPGPSFRRSLREVLLAYRLEKNLSKEQILHLYLNHMYLGNSAYGVEAAARTYFGKHVSALTLAESAVLACLPRAPSFANPYAKPENTRSRQLVVLGHMLSLGFVTGAEYDAAVAQPLEYKSMPELSGSAGSRHLEEVRRQLIAFFDEANVKRLGIAIDIYGEEAVYEGGLHVYTDMEPLRQSASECAPPDSPQEADHWRGITAIRNSRQEILVTFQPSVLEKKTRL